MCHNFLKKLLINTANENLHWVIWGGQSQIIADTPAPCSLWSLSFPLATTLWNRMRKADPREGLCPSGFPEISYLARPEAACSQPDHAMAREWIKAANCWGHQGWLGFRAHLRNSGSARTEPKSHHDQWASADHVCDGKITGFLIDFKSTHSTSHVHECAYVREYL